MAHRYFEGKLHAQIYKQYRPIPPAHLPSKIISFLKEKYDGILNLCIDVGCGTGQSTTLFANDFKEVIGTDISQSMIDQAIANNEFSNVSYQVSPETKLPAPNNSAELITSCQAAHWFNLPKFYAEGQRILKPFGVMAIYGYEFPTFRIDGDTDNSTNDLLKEALNQLYAGDLGGYWAAERKLVDSRYENFVIPYKDFTRNDTLFHDIETNVKDLTMYCSTWSGFQNYCKDHGEESGEKLLNQFENRIMKILKSTDDPSGTKIIKRTSFFLLMARK